MVKIQQWQFNAAKISHKLSHHIPMVPGNLVILFLIIYQCKWTNSRLVETNWNNFENDKQFQ